MTFDERKLWPRVINAQAMRAILLARKLILAPDGSDVGIEPRRRVDNAMVKALARGFRWQKMLETGRYATIKEIANAEKINPSYVSRVLRLILLAPATVEAILEGRANAAPPLAEAMKVFPVEWRLQRGPRLGAYGSYARSAFATISLRGAASSALALLR